MKIIITKITFHFEERGIPVNYRDSSFVRMSRSHLSSDVLLFHFFKPMTTEIIIHASEFQNEAEFIRNEIEKNVSGKLDAYIKRQAKEVDVVRVEMTLDRVKLGSTGKLEVSFPGHAYRSSRENYAKLDDLINHLFVHIKEQMAK